MRVALCRMYSPPTGGYLPNFLVCEAVPREAVPHNGLRVLAVHFAISAGGLRLRSPRSTEGSNCVGGARRSEASSSLVGLFSHSYPSTKADLQINYYWFNEPFAVSQVQSCLYLHVHGLIFETSIWLLAGSTRYLSFISIFFPSSLSLPLP